MYIGERIIRVYVFTCVVWRKILTTGVTGSGSTDIISLSYVLMGNHAYSHSCIIKAAILAVSNK